MADSDDDTPVLSATALAALQSFLAERKAAEEAAEREAEDTRPTLATAEDWQLSQFW
jgi:EEF1A lysine methyltransferase 1